MKLSNVFFFVIGGAIGSLLTKHYLEDKYKQKADEEINDAIAYYKDKEEKAAKENETISKKLEEKTKKIEEFVKQDAAATISAKKMNEHLAGMYRDVSTEEEERIADEYNPYPSINVSAIKFVDADDYLNHDDGYSDVSLTYYQGDGYLIEEDIPVNNVKQVIGNLKLGVNDQKDKIVYIKNDILKSYYEILLTPENFIDTEEED